MYELGTVDYTVLGVMLALSMGIGVYFAVRGGRNSREGYLLGHRRMGVLSTSISMFVTLQSAVSLLGFPSEIYTYGSMIFYIFIAYALTYIAAIYTCLPLLYPLHITSTYEYLERRFESRSVRMLATCIGMLQTLLYMGIALLSPALALQASVGLPLWMSVVIVGLVGTFYTTLGGIRSVVWTDVLQWIFMMMGSVLVLALGVVKIGGFETMMDVNQRENRFQFDVLSADPRVRHSVWGLLIGGFFNWYTNLFGQSTMQRQFAIKSQKGAALAFLLNIPMNISYNILLSLSGLLLVANYFTIRCDPYESGHIANRNQLMPYFVLEILGQYPGLSGLYMATLFSGALSSFSSGINALAANTVEDILAGVLRKTSEKTATIVTKAAVAVYGVLAIGLAYLARSLQGPVTQLTQSAVGATGGPLLGMFFLGALFPWTNATGAFCGGFISIVVMVLLSVFGQLYGVRPIALHPAPTDGCEGNITAYGNVSSWTWTNKTVVFYDEHDIQYQSLYNRPFYPYDISYMWYGLTGFLVALIVGVIASCLSGRRNPETLDSNLLFPFARNLWRKSLTPKVELTNLAERQPNLIS